MIDGKIDEELLQDSFLIKKIKNKIVLARFKSHIRQVTNIFEQFVIAEHFSGKSIIFIKSFKNNNENDATEGLII